MKGLIRKAALALCCVAGAGGMGCVTYHDLVDPCYPARYEAEAEHEVSASYAPQVGNGHVLDQTVWNYDFEVGSDKLTGGGMEHLGYIARRRPTPDPVVYLQTAHDELTYDPTKPEEMSAKRQDLDARRVMAVQKFLNALTDGRRGEFQVQVHDPSPVGVWDAWGALEVNSLMSRVRGGLSTGGGGSASGGAPPTGPAPPP
ncbi:MAG TPA: hypothetical protein VMS17_07345 [Gemmataceae bacterium]|nr:hypothetical protein [Gemmataceae bacterium]